MKNYISADIEGVTGVTHWDETDLQKADMAASREQMTAEVVAACEGALQAGATEIWVKDAHDTGRNLIASRLPHEVRLIRGWSGHPWLMVQELDETFHAAMFVGYHSRAGSNSSPLAHTMTGALSRVLLNGRFASEYLLHTYVAAYLKVPVVFVSGDKGLCEEATQFNSNIRSVAVKEGIGNSTVSIHPELAVSMIRDGVEKALQGNVAQCQVALPVHFTLDILYRDHTKALLYGYFPGAQQIDSHTVRFESDSYFEVMRFLLFAA